MLFQVNFDPIQEIGPNVGGGCSFVRLQCKNLPSKFCSSNFPHMVYSVGHTLPAVAGTSCPAELVGRVLNVLPPAGGFFHGYEGHCRIQEDPDCRPGEQV